MTECHKISRDFFFLYAYEYYNIFSFFCYTKYEVLILGFIYYFLFDIIERIIKEENHELR